MSEHVIDYQAGDPVIVNGKIPDTNHQCHKAVASIVGVSCSLEGWMIRLAGCPDEIYHVPTAMLTPAEVDGRAWFAISSYPKDVVCYVAGRAPGWYFDADTDPARWVDRASSYTCGSDPISNHRITERAGLAIAGSLPPGSKPVEGETLFYAKWQPRDGNPDRKGRGFDCCFKIQGGILWYYATSATRKGWTACQRQKGRIAYFREHYQPCKGTPAEAEREALASIGVVEEEWPKWFTRKPSVKCNAVAQAACLEADPGQFWWADGGKSWVQGTRWQTVSFCVNHKESPWVECTHAEAIKLAGCPHPKYPLPVEDKPDPKPWYYLRDKDSKPGHGGKLMNNLSRHGKRFTGEWIIRKQHDDGDCNARWDGEDSWVDGKNADHGPAFRRIPASEAEALIAGVEAPAEQPAEYFLSPAEWTEDTPREVSRTTLSLGWRVRGKAAHAWYSDERTWVASATLSPAQVRQHCTPCTEAEAIAGKLAVRYYEGSASGIYRTNPDGTFDIFSGGRWSSVNYKSEANLPGKLITEARARELCPAAFPDTPAEPEPAEGERFVVGSYADFNGRIYRIMSQEAYRKANPKTVARCEKQWDEWLVCGEHSSGEQTSWWGTINFQATSPWQPKPGDKVWVDGPSNSFGGHYRGFAVINDEFKGNADGSIAFNMKDKIKEVDGNAYMGSFPLSSIHPASFAPEPVEEQPVAVEPGTGGIEFSLWSGVLRFNCGTTTRCIAKDGAWTATNLWDDSIEYGHGIPESEALEWMDKNGVDWHEAMGPKCLIEKGETRYFWRAREEGLAGEWVYANGKIELSQFSMGTLAKQHRQICTEPTARKHIGLDAEPIPAEQPEPKDKPMASTPDMAAQFPIDARVRHKGLGWVPVGVTGTVVPVADFYAEWKYKPGSKDPVAIRLDELANTHRHCCANPNNLELIDDTPAPAAETQGREPITDGKDETMNNELIEWASHVECPACGGTLETRNRGRRKLNHRDRVFYGKCGYCRAPVAIKAKNWTAECEQPRKPAQEGDKPKHGRAYRATSFTLRKLVWKPFDYLVIDWAREGIKGIKRATGTAALVGGGIYFWPELCWIGEAIYKTLAT